MLKSMTGFGRAELNLENKKIAVEIRSLNSKQLDLNIKLPTAFRAQELDLRRKIATEVERGKVEVQISLEQNSSLSEQKINADLLKNYYEQIRQIAQQNAIPEPSDWFQLLLKMPEVIQNQQSEFEEEDWQKIEETFNLALNEFQNFRLQEGITLEENFQKNLEKIEQLLLEIAQYESERIEKIKANLRAELEKLSIDFDKNRFEQELIFYIEKLDVNEEKVRLKNHIDYFRQTMQNADACGKKLGFIAQEMGREINTLGSKSNHSQMQKIVVQMKDELEQIKEQVLNIL